MTTPTANSAIIAFDQRLASVLYIGSPVRRCSPSAIRTNVGNAIPKHTSGMCAANDSACICRASFR